MTQPIKRFLRVSRAYLEKPNDDRGDDNVIELRDAPHKRWI